MVRFPVENHSCWHIQDEARISGALRLANSEKKNKRNIDNKENALAGFIFFCRFPQPVSRFAIGGSSKRLEDSHSQHIHSSQGK